MVAFFTSCAVHLLGYVLLAMLSKVGARMSFGKLPSCGVWDPQSAIAAIHKGLESYPAVYQAYVPHVAFAVLHNNTFAKNLVFGRTSTQIVHCAHSPSRKQSCPATLIATFAWTPSCIVGLAF